MVRSTVMPALLTRMSRRPCCSRTSWIVRWQSSQSPTLPWCTLMSAPSRLSSSAKLCARSAFEEKPAATTAPSSANRRLIAAPIPRVPPVTRATRPDSRPGRVAGAGLVSVTLMRNPPPSVSLVRALRQPLGDLRPDLVARLRARHQADVTARPVQVRHVLGADEVEHGQRAGPRCDVIRAGRHHQQVLVDPPQVDAAAAQAQRAPDQPVLLVHPGDPLPVRASRERRVVGHPAGPGLVRPAGRGSGEDPGPQLAGRRPPVPHPPPPPFCPGDPPAGGGGEDP